MNDVDAKPAIGRLMSWVLSLVLLACAGRQPLSASAAPPVPSATERKAPLVAPLVRLRLIAFNDFHGNLEPLRQDGRPLGGAQTFAAYVRHLQMGYEGRTLLVHAGDQVGASPAASGLLQDEPAIELLNLLANERCQLPGRDDPGCNVVGTLGNHEFDEGVTELLRLLRGGNFAKGPFLQSPYAGARFPYVSANVIDRATGASLLPSYVVRDVGGVNVGVIGAVLRDARRLVNPASVGLDAIEFVDELTAVNRAASELAAKGVSAIVLAIHEGLEQAYYAGPTQRGASASGDLTPIVLGLHDEIDVVVSGHTHSFTNVLVNNASGQEVLVVQSSSAGRAVATVDLAIHPPTNRVVGKVAEVHQTFGDVAPGNVPQPDVAALVTAATSLVAAQTTRVVGKANVTLTHEINDAGESALGNLVADAQRQATKADLALTNPGGIRAALAAGPVTWGQLFTVQPFRNQLVLVTLTGRELADVLERQWQGGSKPRFLQISGFSYVWDAAAAKGNRVVAIRAPNGVPLAANHRYCVVVNSYMASGGDDFGLENAPQEKLEKTDLDALVEYVAAHPRGIDTPASGRVHRRQ